jgi:hypothetical protein
MVLALHVGGVPEFEGEKKLYDINQDFVSFSWSLQGELL